MTRSTVGNDPVRLRGTSNDDRLLGGDGDNRIGGAAGHDTLDGGAGDDLLRGGGGNDILRGGAGMDTALFAGSRDGYRIAPEPEGGFTVRHAGGVDVLEGVESLRFGDGELLRLGGANAALHWNRIALYCVGDSGSNPLHASRALAIESLAVLEIADRRFDLPGADDPARPDGLLVPAAIAAAAHRVLSALFPGEADDLDQDLALALARTRDGAREDAAVSYGRAVAEAMLAARADDGSGDVEPYATSGLPGRWEPTPPGFGAPAVP